MTATAFADDSIGPDQEGVYEIHGTSDAFQPDRLVVMDTNGAGNWVAAFSNSASGTVIYTFNLSVKSGQIIGASIDPTVLRSAEILIDSQTGSVSGTLHDSRAPGLLGFTGNRRASPADLLSAAPKTTEACAASPAGTYLGALDSAAGTLTVTAIDSAHFAATFVSSGNAPFSADFNVEFTPASGLLYLIHQNADNTFLKLALLCGDHGRVWTGLGFAFLAGANYPVNFEVKP